MGPHADPHEAVKAPAIALICIFGLSALANLVGVAMHLFGAGWGMLNAGSSSQSEMLAQMLSGGLGLAFYVLAIALDGFVIWAAVRMMKLQGYTMAMAAAIIATIPCFSACCIGMPFGIWALVVLSKDEVKSSFTLDG